MKHLRTIHTVRTLVALLVFAGLLAAGGSLWWANQTGLPDSWRAEVEKALAAQGLHADIAGLRYWPLQGVEADEVTVYDDESRGRVLARVSEVVIKIDRSKLARGEVRVERLDLTGGTLSLPADPEDPSSKVLEVTEVSGRLLMPGRRRFEIRGGRGLVNGIRLELDASFLGYRERLHDEDPEDDEELAYRRKQLARVIELLEQWKFTREAPPIIRLRLEGDLEDPKSVRAAVSLATGRLEHGGVVLEQVAAAGEMRGRLLALDTFEARDGGGALKGRMEFDMAARSGHVEAESNLDLPTLLADWDTGGWLERIRFRERPRISARGSFEWPEEGKPKFHLTGNLEVEDVRFEGHTVSKVESDVAWDGVNLFFDNVVATRPDGTARGRVLSRPGEIRYEAFTDLRIGVWQWLFDHHPLGPVLADFSDRDDTRVSARVEGRLNPHDHDDWSAKGEAKATHMSYRGTAFREAEVKMDLSHDFLDFTEGKVTFDYADYALRKAHGGPATGQAEVALVRWDREASVLKLEGIDGEFWPAPVLRCILPEVADHLEDYRFHTPPKLEASGVIGLSDHGEKKTDFRISGSTEGTMSYRFAGKDLQTTGLKTRVQVRSGSTLVRNLSFDVFGGGVRGEFDVLPRGGRTQVKGEFDWTRLRLPELSTTYGFEKGAKGFVTGRIDFEQIGSDVSGFNGEGLVGLEEGELFSVPIFGPLSPVLSAVLANPKAGFQEAKEAFCTFTVKEGVMSTRDFLTMTSSLVFTGDATVDLNRTVIEMTIRMNARGLLGVITLPLKPFYGLFQFRGVGPLKEPEWNNVMFTSPPEQEEKRLLDPPKAVELQIPAAR